MKKTLVIRAWMIVQLGIGGVAFADYAKEKWQQLETGFWLVLTHLKAICVQSRWDIFSFLYTAENTFN